MLEIKNLCKTYYPKNGQPVQALKSVSAKFTEKGLVFILGKSGCGKSTLLNCIGGLDKFDSGEIVIKGKSSKEFTGSDFDSYRNTFIGFIFQEYNILSEFNIEKNIALALELQGKKADKEAVQNILEMVDLKEFGKRKTTELSGGQKQRVAIARALIKDPEIIVADEPTGALDSATGIQVFDTLKKLAQEKLVIVVSHDREFAEIYGDRIIEMKDGVIISDETKRKVKPNSVSDDLTFIGEDLIHIKKGHKFSADEKDLIIKFLESRDTETIISVDDRKNQQFKKVAKIDENNHTEKFTDTTDEDRKSSKEYNKNDLKLIKSKLKQKDAFKIGTSSLKSKPIRLVFTILLSVVAFTLFGFVDSLSAYNKNKTTINSIMDGNLKNLTFTAEEKYSYTSTDWETGEEEVEYSYRDTTITQSDMEKLKEDLGIEFKGVYSPQSNLYLADNYKESDSIDFYNSYIRNSATGYIYLSEEDIESLEYTLTGRLPQNANEIVITEYMFKTHTFTGYKNPQNSEQTIGKSEITMNDDGSANSIIGKNYRVGEEVFVIVGVLDTEFNYDKYNELDPTNRSGGQTMATYMLVKEIDQVVKNGYHSLIITNEAFMQNVKSKIRYELVVGTQENYGHFSYNMSVSDSSMKPVKVSDESIDASRVYYFNGFSAGELQSNQVILDISVLDSLNWEVFYNGELNNIYNLFGSTSQKISDVITPDQIEKIKASREMFIPEGMSLNFRQANNSQSNNLFEVVGFYIQDVAYGSKTESKVIFTDAVASDFQQVNYMMAIAQMPTDRETVTKVVNYFYDNYNEESDLRFVLGNEVVSMILEINDMLESLSSVLIWVGLAFCVFASLMLMNFIATSISYKKREIGILRAIGARKKDVFSIFYSEALVIGLINFVLATIASFVVISILNQSLRNEYGLVITILNFGIRQIAILLAVSVFVAFISSLLPVNKIAKKQPIDAINNR